MRLHSTQKILSSPMSRMPPRVVDAVIFSTELDLLEIRLRELWDVVDLFVVIEAPLTFTGLPKPLVLQENIERFRDPFDNEARTRQAMAKLLQQSAGLSDGDLLIGADVDEIPAAHAVRLFRQCTGYPDKVHLAMPSFLYSFEFPRRDETMYRPWIRVFRARDATVQYCHGCIGEYALEDAGWHCSWCFRTLGEIRFKMLSYSHSDRVTGPAMLDEDRLQRVVCSGEDVFGMLPEAYTWKSLVGNMGPASRARSAVHVPRAVIENTTRYSFLLPGHCKRPAGTTYIE
eukprot:m51a1_g12791 hypothetical protein (287) ;mRNA; r:1147-3478